ncbi:MAG TPA: regulatory protein RecX [Candidatus Absconditabacterales bacterium]|nr:regulatory protein RecX [Candidatus Absconditabacterales bacterium]
MQCFDYALKYIYRYPKTEKELRIQLYTKGYNTKDIDRTMGELKKKNYINDEMFTESYIRSEVINKGKPAIRIVQKLQQKGVPQEIVKDILKKYDDEMGEGIHDKIKKEIQAYKRKDVDGFDIIQKLMRKGYKLADIKKVIEHT